MKKFFLFFLLFLFLKNSQIVSGEIDSSLSLKKKEPSNQVFLSSTEHKDSSGFLESVEEVKPEPELKEKEEKKAFYLSQPVNYGTVESRIQRNSGQESFPYRVKPRMVYSSFIMNSTAPELPSQEIQTRENYSYGYNYNSPSYSVNSTTPELASQEIQTRENYSYGYNYNSPNYSTNSTTPDLPSQEIQTRENYSYGYNYNLPSYQVMKVFEPSNQVNYKSKKDFTNRFSFIKQYKSKIKNPFD